MYEYCVFNRIIRKTTTKSYNNPYNMKKRMKYNIITKVCYIFELNSEQEMFANEYMICFQLITPHIIKLYKTIYDYFVIYTEHI